MLKFIPTAHVSDATLVAKNDDFGVANNRMAVFGADGHRAARTVLGIEHFSHSVVRHSGADTTENADHGRVCRLKGAFAWEKNLGKEPIDQAGSGKSAERGEHANDGSSEEVAMGEQIPCTAEPAEEGNNREAVDRRHLTAAMRVTGLGAGFGKQMAVAPNMPMAKVQVEKATKKSDEAEGKAYAEADQVKGVGCGMVKGVHLGPPAEVGWG